MNATAHVTVSRASTLMIEDEDLKKTVSRESLFRFWGLFETVITGIRETPCMKKNMAARFEKRTSAKDNVRHHIFFNLLAIVSSGAEKALADARFQWTNSAVARAAS